MILFFRILFFALSMGLIFYALALPEGWLAFLFVGVACAASSLIDWGLKSEKDTI